MTDKQAAELEARKREIDEQLIAHAQAGGKLSSHRIKRHRSTKQLLVGRLNYQKVAAELTARAEAVGLAPDSVFEQPRLKPVNELIKMGVLTGEDENVLWATFQAPAAELESAEYAERESKRTSSTEKPGAC